MFLPREYYEWLNSLPRWIVLIILFAIIGTILCICWYLKKIKPKQ